MAHSSRKHEHVPLMHGRARAAQTYPDALCNAICQGIVKQIQEDRQGQFMLAQLSAEYADASDAKRELDWMLQECRTVEEDDGVEFLSAFDDVSGAPKSSFAEKFPADLARTREALET